MSMMPFTLPALAFSGPIPKQPTRLRELEKMVQDCQPSQTHPQFYYHPNLDAATRQGFEQALKDRRKLLEELFSSNILGRIGNPDDFKFAFKRGGVLNAKGEPSCIYFRCGGPVNAGLYNPSAAHMAKLEPGKAIDLAIHHLLLHASQQAHGKDLRYIPQQAICALLNQAPTFRDPQWMLPESLKS